MIVLFGALFILYDLIMRNLSLIILISLFPLVLYAQEHRFSSVDTAGFSAFSVQDLFGGLSLAENLAYYEYITQGEEQSIAYRFGKTVKGKQALSKRKAEVNDGFGSTCPPGVCYWYYMAIKKDATVMPITSYGLLPRMVPRARSLHDALFYLQHHNISGSLSYPHQELPLVGKYKKIENGHLLVVNRRTSDCPVTYTDLLLHISDKGVITRCDEHITETSDICY